MSKHVFVDLTGRRRQAAVVLGAGLGVFLLLGLLVVGFGLLNSSPVPLPGWPESVQRGVDVAPPPPSSPSPETSTKPKPTASVPTANTSPEPSRGQGHGQGHGKPSKTPGKP